MSTHNTPTVGPAVWYGPDVETDDSWAFNLERGHIAELETVVDEVIATGESLIDLEQAACEMPSLSPQLRAIQQDVVTGRGFALIRGVPVDRWSTLKSATAFWVVDRHFGSAISQNDKGHLLGHVCDIHADLSDPKSRKYATNAAQPFHTDSCDIVALLCLQTAMEGGLSSMSSSATIHAEMTRQRPDLAAALSQPLPVDRKAKFPRVRLRSIRCLCSTILAGRSPRSTPEISSTAHSATRMRRA